MKKFKLKEFLIESKNSDRNLDKESNSGIKSFSPIDEALLGTVSCTSDAEYQDLIQKQLATFKKWRLVPAPKRGMIIKEIGEVITANKEELSQLLTMEMGKILEEARGEIQEIIDIIDFAVGLSRQLYGNSMKSERENHRMFEQWHPLGIVGVITAFNFPVAVWGWNAMLAAVCGNVTLWKPSELTPLIAIAINRLAEDVATSHGYEHLFGLVQGHADLGKTISTDRRITLVSATGSCRMGRSVAATVGGRLGKTLLELGGNNAVIVMPDANLELALQSLLFGVVGTAGQRCTSTRRVFVHESLIDELTTKLSNAFAQVSIGDPLDTKNLMGPVIHANAVADYLSAIEKAKSQGGDLICGGNVQEDIGKFFVEPSIIRTEQDLEIMKQETFAPVVYITPFKDLESAIERQNNVDQGLSSAIFTNNLQDAELFLSAAGSDCGIANVNIGTSGAEIGGAFGGEKDTGGGRESGSDAWKAYMRRQTNTINYGKSLPLAQGIKFEL